MIAESLHLSAGEAVVNTPVRDRHRRNFLRGSRDIEALIVGTHWMS